MPTGSPTETRPDLAWPGESLRLVPWLAEFADVPDDASPPLYMSPVPEDAVCSYAWSGCTHLPEGEPDALTWIEREQVIVPGRDVRARWWQRLAITRQLEHREDGTLCARVVLGSAPRRAGKSVRMRGIALWRLHARWLFGEVQLVMHTGSDMAICREVQRGAWRWATSRWGKDAVTMANGKESIETPAGDRWLVRSQDGVYGYDVTLGLGDECWNVKPETINEGLEPATLERVMPQLDLTSTAHRRATSLMRGRIATAMAVNDPEVLLLLWAAPPGSDPSDPAVWRAASPHWSEDRRKLIAAKYEAALAGQADPQADDPDPVAGFTSQYLNVWRLNERASRGEPITTPEAWDELAAPRPAGHPNAVAVEAWFTGGVSVGMAWRDPLDKSRVIVAVAECRTVDAAAALIRAMGYRGVVIVGKGLAEHPTFRGMRVSAQSARSAEAVVKLGGLLRDDTLRHDGGLHLTGQATEVRTTMATDGPRVVSGTRTDAIKVAVWAAERAAIAPAKRTAMPSRYRKAT
jgi:hypothetical protein